MMAPRGELATPTGLLLTVLDGTENEGTGGFLAGYCTLFNCCAFKACKLIFFVEEGLCVSFEAMLGESSFAGASLPRAVEVNYKFTLLLGDPFACAPATLVIVFANLALRGYFGSLDVVKLILRESKNEGLFISPSSFSSASSTICILICDFTSKGPLRLALSRI